MGKYTAKIYLEREILHELIWKYQHITELFHIYWLILFYHMLQQ